MNRYKTVCQWCPRLYTSAGRYSNHLAKFHPEKTVGDLEAPKSRKRRISNATDTLNETHTLETSPGQNIDELNLAEIISGEVDFSDTYHSEGSDREARQFSSESESESESESDEASQQIDVIKYPGAGNPIREHVFPECDINFNLFAPFKTPIDYRLARFFNSTKTSQAKIDQFFKDNLLKALNPTHQVQFRSAYTMYKIIDAAACEPSWSSGAVNYPLLKGVGFHYRNIISAVKYLLRQKVYATDMVWGPRQEYDKQGNRVYSEIHTATWWDETQVSNSDVSHWISD